MGKNTFNAGTSSQRAQGSYFLLKEVVKNHKIETVYLEVYYDILRDNEVFRTPTAAYIITDYMNPSLNKWEYLWTTGGEEYLMHGILPARRNWGNLFDISYMADLLRKKINKSYRDYEYITYDDECYAGKGFVSSEKQIEPGSFCREQAFEPIGKNAISTENKKYLGEIIKYAKQKILV